MTAENVQIIQNKGVESAIKELVSATNDKPKNIRLDATIIVLLLFAQKNAIQERFTETLPNFMITGGGSWA